MSNDMFFSAEGKKVMVVDDNEVNSMVVASMLEQFAIQVTEVYSGKDAVEKAKYEDFDVIFMDYLMPEMNGIETTEEIRKLGKVKSPAIIGLSADVTPELKSKFSRAGADNVLAKPLTLEALQQLLEEWVPKEQVASLDSKKQAGDDAKQIIEIFSQVNGLNVEEGLSHLGNTVENYIKVLETAVDNIRQQQKHLFVYSESLIQPSSMKISFHSLKGIFLNLGAHKLSEQSQLFELACTNSSVDLLSNDLEQYLKDLDVFVGSLEQGLAQYDGDYKKKQAEQYRPLDEENFTKYYDKLVNDLQKYEYNDLRELTNTLMYASKGEKRILFENVLKEIQNFQYEAALELLGKGQE